MTTGIKITCDEMRYIALFESISGASVKDCIIDEEQERAIFIVNQGQVGVAIGKGGRNIHTLERMTGKKPGSHFFRYFFPAENAFSICFPTCQ